MALAKDTDLYMLLMRLRTGGTMVSGTWCTVGELALARTEHRVYEDKDGFVYVYRPPGSGQHNKVVPRP